MVNDYLVGLMNFLLFDEYKYFLTSQILLLRFYLHMLSNSVVYACCIHA